MKGNRVWAEIDLAALHHNVTLIRRAVGPRVRIMAVIKADAYGHGALPIAYTALHAGCDWLGVGDSGEALELRESGITGPILILGAIMEKEIPAVATHDISVTVHSTDFLDALDNEARRRGRQLRVHLKVDTGMARLGASPARALDVARGVIDHSNLRLEGLSTHLASAANANATRIQLDRFHAVADELSRDGIEPPILHAANSVGLFSTPESHFDMVRPGIALYGIDPGPFATLGLKLQPVMSLHTRIAYLKGVAQGTAVGYGSRQRMAHATTLATCPAGYNDGYPYALSHKGDALVRGRRAPLAGPVTMDYIMLDVGKIPEADVGDEVTLIGKGLRAEELARRIGTIPYELTCGLGKRVKRVPVNVEQSVPAAFRVVA